jgi:gas vesicle protein
MKKITAYIIGGFAGAVLISGLVLLLAPTSGKELRERIRVKYLELESEFKEASRERRAELEDQLARLRTGLPSGME